MNRAEMLARAGSRAWDVVEPKSLYGLFTSAVRFANRSGIASRRGLKPLAPAADTTRYLKEATSTMASISFYR